ncbi:putative Endonuclease/exonuclease/phosphatase superfamily [Helianthus annuus]|uniref:Endonuclease/exonuclease/phosphatase superfamily n=1 Tax=Helianthus annuus TaxID=4232 RepID=A0A9K3IE77_HELAN|nr:putative Endonuclease/exonuclease/phosphatase superfamily [Helianthus annuus]
MQSVIKKSHFMLIKGRIVGNSQDINIINIYAPHSVSGKKSLWNSLKESISGGEGRWILPGDFNTVRFPEERKNSAFNRSCAIDFNEFIFLVGLEEYSMRGRSFTFQAPNSNKLSKIDRVLVCKGFSDKWPGACLRALPRIHSDHSPLILRTNCLNFGHKPFKFFNSWLEVEGFDNLVENALNSFVKSSIHSDINLMLKLKHVRGIIRRWVAEKKKKKRIRRIRLGTWRSSQTWIVLVKPGILAKKSIGSKRNV